MSKKIFIVVPIERELNENHIDEAKLRAAVYEQKIKNSGIADHVFIRRSELDRECTSCEHHAENLKRMLDADEIVICGNNISNHAEMLRAAALQCGKIVTEMKPL